MYYSQITTKSMNWIKSTSVKNCNTFWIKT